MQRPSVRSEQKGTVGARKGDKNVKKEDSGEQGKIGYTKGCDESRRKL